MLHPPTPSLRLRLPPGAPSAGRVTHRLILTYKLSLSEGGKCTPTLPMLNRWVGPGGGARRGRSWPACRRGGCARVSAGLLYLTAALQLSPKGYFFPCRSPFGSRSYVYDGELEAQMFMLFDGNKQRLAVGGAPAGAAVPTPLMAQPLGGAAPPDVPRVVGLSVASLPPACSALCSLSRRHLPGSGAAQEGGLHHPGLPAPRQRPAAGQAEGKPAS